MSQSLSTLCRPSDDIMCLIGEAVSERRALIARQYHEHRYIAFARCPQLAAAAMGDLAYRKQLVNNQNHYLIAHQMLHIAADNRYFARLDGRPVPTLPSDVNDPLPTRGEKGRGLFSWSDAARESRFSRNKTVLELGVTRTLLG